MNNIDICTVSHFTVKQALPENEKDAFRFVNQYYICDNRSRDYYVNHDGNLDHSCANGWFKTLSGAMVALVKCIKKNNYPV